MIVRRKPLPRRVQYEWLEERALLTIFDLATIAGRVFRDATGNGFDQGEQISGAAVELYRVNGEAGRTLVRTATTDSAGNYQFDRLTVATYVVVQPAQTVGGTQLAESTSDPIVLALADVQGVRGTTIDTFNDTTHAAFATAGQTNSGISVAAAPEAIGGTRKLQVFLSGTDGGIALSANTPTNGSDVLDFHESGTGGAHIVTWDGTSPSLPPQAQSTPNPRGLGGVDLTDEGASTGLALLIAGDAAGGQIQIVVNSSITNVSTATVTASHFGPRNGLQLYPLHEAYVPFSSFTSGVGGGADFTDVGSIRITWLNDDSRANGQIDELEAIGPTVKTHDFSNLEDGGEIELIDLELTMLASDPTPAGNVVFTIVVENVGTAAATGVAVRDVLPSGLTFVGSSSAAYNSGTGVWTVGELAVDDSATLEVTARFNTSSPVTNTAEVSAADQEDVDSTPDNDNSLEDDQASVTVTPRIGTLSLAAKVNGEDANSATGPYVPLGGSADFTYELTNTGDALLDLTDLFDDNGTPNDTSDDIDVLEFGDFLGENIGEAGLLDPGETWTFALLKSLTSAGQYESSARAAAATAGQGEEAPAASTDTDQAHAFAYFPGVRLTMQVNGDDANIAPGAVVSLGSRPRFTYAIENAGNVPLANLTLVDDNGTPDDLSDDVDIRVLGDFLGRDSGLQGALDPGEIWTFRYDNALFAEGQFSARSLVIGFPTDHQGQSLEDAGSVTDGDPVHFLVQQEQQPPEQPPDPLDPDIAVGVTVANPAPVAEALPPLPPIEIPVVPAPTPFLFLGTSPTNAARVQPIVIYGNSAKVPDYGTLPPPRLAESVRRLSFHEMPEEHLQQILLTLAEIVIADVEVADLADVQLARASVNLPELPKDFLEAPEEPGLEMATAWSWYLPAAAGFALACSVAVILRPKLVERWLVRPPRQFGRELGRLGLRARQKISSVFAHSWW